MTDMFMVLCAPRRREILRQVWEKERTAGEIFAANPDVTFGAVSQHLKILQDAGLVSCREAGQYRYYLARKEELGQLKAWLESMWDDALYRLKIRAEIEEAKRGPRAQQNEKRSGQRNNFRKTRKKRRNRK